MPAILVLRAFRNSCSNVSWQRCIWRLTQFAARAQGANDMPNVMVILDASRSMWAQIDGVNKVVSAHNAVNAILQAI